MTERQHRDIKGYDYDNDIVGQYYVVASPTFTGLIPNVRTLPMGTLEQEANPYQRSNDEMNSLGVTLDKSVCCDNDIMIK